jgi:phosphoserine aminotransferase
MVGRSHRDPVAIDKIQSLADKQRKLLNIPANYHLGVFLGSNTGAFEAALWNLLGPKPVDVIITGHFSNNWLDDVQQLAETPQGIPSVHPIGIPFKTLPNLQDTNPDHDCVVTWHDTPAGTIIPNGNFIGAKRDGLVFVDATSAAFCTDLPWQQFDAVSWSWQKALGGEPGFGMLALSPRAWERLQNYTPSWPVPSFLRLHSEASDINTLPFDAKPLNTISMLAIEDALIVTSFAEERGLNAMIQHSRKGLEVVSQWLEQSPHPFKFLIQEQEWRSPIAIAITTQDDPQKAYKIADLLSQHSVAFDIKGHAASPPCIRIWNGPTVNLEDLEKLLPWLDWAFQEVS